MRYFWTFLLLAGCATNVIDLGDGRYTVTDHSHTAESAQAGAVSKAQGFCAKSSKNAVVDTTEPSPGFGVVNFKVVFRCQ